MEIMANSLFKWFLPNRIQKEVHSHQEHAHNQEDQRDQRRGNGR